MVVKWDRPKDPDEVLDYDLDWNDEATPGLDPGDTISTSEWILPPGITLQKQSEGVRSGSTQSYIWLTGGTAGVNYDLTNRITTTLGRTMDQTCRLKMKDR